MTRALAAACAVGWVVAVAVTVDGTDSHPVGMAAVTAIVVGVPSLVGFLRGRGDAPDAFARLLMLSGLGLAVVALSESPHPVPYSLGRTAWWLVEPGIIYLILAFPTGRLSRRVDRALMAGALLVVAVLYLPTIPFTVHFPMPTPWTDCSGGCPDNAFAVVSKQPAVIADVIRPLREALTAAMVLGVTATLAVRTLAARRLLRATLVPVLMAAMVHLVAISLYLVIRNADPQSGILVPIGFAYQLSLPLIALAFAFGHVARLAYAANGLERLAHALRSGAHVRDVGRIVAMALEDPSLRLLHRVPGLPGHWSDESGQPVELPEPGPGVGVTLIGPEGAYKAALIHDPVLDEDPTLVRAAAEIALLRLDNELLVRRLSRSLAELERSRARLAAAADSERQRIERSLHDGAQQRLVGLRIRLSMLRDRLELVAPGEAATVDDLGDQVETAIEEIRNLAKGIYPPLLTQSGLASALQAAGRTSELPVTVDAGDTGRYPTEIETAVYFTCTEALQNAVKHAEGASGVQIRLWTEDGELCFEVCDDGSGFQPEGPEGSGLSNMRDRIAAAGGELTVESRPGEGTRVAGHIRPATGARNGVSVPAELRGGQ